VCTVVSSWVSGEPLRILAIRDEFVSRSFDGPGAWWPEQPSVVGGRDRQAGGSWCVSDVSTGVTAVVLNPLVRREGAPSRGLLPLAAVAVGESWTDAVDYRLMASFNLMIAGPAGATIWRWDMRELRRDDLAPRVHMITNDGVDADTPKTARFAPLFRELPWYDVVTGTGPSEDPSALIVRHETGDDVNATVFGQLITAVPGSLQVASSTTPWIDGTWIEQTW
jgi:uncharacterized protein with NRDE domain